MKLALKLTVAILACMLLALRLNARIAVREQMAAFEAEATAYQAAVGTALRPALAHVWKTEGKTRALEIVHEVDEAHPNVDIRWVDTDTTDSDLAPKLSSDHLQPFGNNRVFSFLDRGYANGEGRLFTYVSVDLGGGKAGAIEMSQTLLTEQSLRSSALRQALYTGIVISFVAAFATGALGAVVVGRPTLRLIEHARRIGDGDLSKSIGPMANDELGALGHEMERMRQRLAAANELLARESAARASALDELRHADRLATVGRLAAGMAHEMGTPLHVALARIKQVSRASTDVTVRETTRIVQEQLERMTNLMRQLLDFARKRRLRKSSVDLRTILEHTQALLSALSTKRGVVIDVQLPSEPIIALVDAVQLEQVMTNLVVNAIDASRENQRVALSVRRESATPPLVGGPAIACACVAVTDEGAGILPEHRDALFEPFFTTKEVGEGTGLGLSIAYGIVAEHGGWIDVKSVVGEGTSFEVHIPESS